MVLQRVRLALHIIGTFLTFFALAYLVPLLTAFYYGEDWRGFLYSLLATLTVGLALQFGLRTDRAIERPDGFIIVAFTWLLIPLFGTLPYMLPPVGLSFVNALFEAMSGFTTTGATILEVVEELPRSAVLWRSLTQWLGGMGVIAIFIAILPRLAVGGSQLFDREFPDPLPEKLRPRFRSTARVLWSIYAGFTAAQIALLYFLARLPLFDSICVSFSTMPTGGFTPHTESIGFYGNPVAEWIIMGFMFLAGTRFIVHYHLLRGNPRVLKGEEFRLYVIILAAAIGLLILAQGLSSYREGFFQAISIMTTTGFVTTDFAQWSSGARMLLLALMFIGACGGSTGGGMKVMRALTLIKQAGGMMTKAISPKAVVPLKLDHRPVPEAIVRDIISFVFLYILIAVLASIALGFLGLGLEEATSAVAASLGNVGPGLGGVGPASNYAWLPGAAKVILILLMWVGRLEFFAVFMIFFPRVWKA